MKLLLRLRVLKHHRFNEIKIQLLLIQHVKHDHVVALKTKVLEPFDNLLRLIVKIRYQDDDSSPREQLRCSIEQVGYRSAPAGLEPLDNPKDGSQMPGPRARRNVFNYVLIKCNQSDGIVLSNA